MSSHRLQGRDLALHVVGAERRRGSFCNPHRSCIPRHPIANELGNAVVASDDARALVEADVVAVSRDMRRAYEPHPNSVLSE